MLKKIVSCLFFSIFCPFHYRKPPPKMRVETMIIFIFVHICLGLTLESGFSIVAVESTIENKVIERSACGEIILTAAVSEEKEEDVTAAVITKLNEVKSGTFIPTTPNIKMHLSPEFNSKLSRFKCILPVLKIKLQLLLNFLFQNSPI